MKMDCRFVQYLYFDYLFSKVKKREFEGIIDQPHICISMMLLIFLRRPNEELTILDVVIEKYILPEIGDL